MEINYDLTCDPSILKNILITMHIICIEKIKTQIKVTMAQDNLLPCVLCTIVMLSIS